MIWLPYFLIKKEKLVFKGRKFLLEREKAWKVRSCKSDAL